MLQLPVKLGMNTNTRVEVEEPTGHMHFFTLGQIGITPSMSEADIIARLGKSIYTDRFKHTYHVSHNLLIVKTLPG
jgi:hypothetical protein